MPTSNDATDPPVWETTENEWPLALTEYEQWMASKQKRPVAPWSSTPDTKYKWGGDHTHNWADFEKAQNAAEIMDSLDDSLAFIIQSPDDPYTADPDPFLFIDGDNVRLPDGRVHPAYVALIDGLGESFTEASTSGTGLHTLYEGRLPDGHETGFAFDLPDHPAFDDAHVEVYHGKRVCICTGTRVTALSGEVRPCDPDALLGLTMLVDGTSGRSRDTTSQTTLAEQRDAKQTDATRDFDVVRAAIDGLTVHDVRLRSTKTAERADGSLDYDPSFARSESGKRLGIDGGQVVYRDGNHGGDILSLIAWEEGIIDPGDRLAEKDFWDAVRAARDRGAPIPAYAPDDQNEQVVHRPGEDVTSIDRPIAEAEAITAPDDDPDDDTDENAEDAPDALAANAAADSSSPPPDDAQGDVGPDAGEGAAQRGPSWEQVRIYFDDDDVEHKDAVQLTVDKLTRDEHWMVHPDNDEALYWYNPDKGIYEPNGDAKVREILERELSRWHTKRLYGLVRHRIRGRSTVPRSEVGGTLMNPLVCVRNGIVNLATGDFIDHTPEQRFIKRIEADYDPDADCPNFHAFLETVFDGEDDYVTLVYELLGHAIHPGYVADGFAIFYGDGSNGKSTLLTMLAKWLGEGNVASYDAQDFEDDQYATGGLYGKMANFGGDLPPDTITNSGVLKKLSAGDPITYNKKYEAQFTFESEATLVFAANDPPAIQDQSHAMFRRLMLANFPVEFSPVGETGPDREPQQDIMERCLSDEERAGLLNRAIEAAQTLRADGFSYPYTVEENRHHHNTVADSVYAFVNAAVEHVDDGDNGDYILSDDLYAAFLQFCEETQSTRKDKSVFVREMKPHLGGRVEKTHPKVQGRQRPAYFPLRFTDRGRQLAGLDSPDDAQQTGLDT